MAASDPLSSELLAAYSLRRMVALLVLSVAAAASSQAADSSLGPYEPAYGCYIGAYVELDPTVKGDVDGFERLVGKKHLSYFRYVGYGQPFPFAWVKELKARGQVPHIAWEPNQGLDAVQDDEYLRGWAEAARRADVPIFLRFASEMNGNWQAWSGDPALYVEKWRLVYRVMHQIAPKVIMVWCPFAVPQGSITSYYPGDEYVDWVGVNIYSVKRHDGDPNKIAGQDPRDLLRYVYKLYAPRKPIAICEYAATHYCNALKLR
ncbi:MAG: glycosyl hydrolase, partial [Armatimonadetes bacterium]|nr:glycosyl hydrolase [Armatimonadota bacterium]